MKYTDIGIYQWTEFFGGNSYNTGRSIIIDDNYNIYISGWTNSLSNGENNSGFSDIFVKGYHH